MENETVVAGCYVDLSQLTPQQIAAQENIGTIPADYIDARRITNYYADLTVITPEQIAELENQKPEITICRNCGKVFSMDVAAKNKNEDFDKLCSDCQVKACHLFFGLFSDFKGE